MAKLHAASNWRATTAFLALLAFVAALLVSVVTGERLGVMLYVLAAVTIGLGFWAREDNAAMGGVIGLNFLVLFDIALRVGVLP